ncbi:sigma-70 family RNA polymerase sigma factor [bacterium]|nr:sigma-70 family RNA polymerase sigma factor [bacterium]
MSEQSKDQARIPGVSQPPGEETRLILACQKGDTDAFEQIIELHQGRVYGLAFQMLHNAEDAEDVAQEVFISCYQSIRRFRGDASLGTWLYRITVNKVRNRWRLQKRRRTASHTSLDAPRNPDDPRPLEIEDPAPGPGRQVQAREAVQALDRAVESLPDDYREIVALRFQQHLSYEEIAEVLDCSLGTVKSRINRARQRLKEELADYI